MEETKNTFSDAIKERLTNPFLGKLFLAWIICNWKIPYVSFFVSEDKLQSNRLDFVSQYLRTQTFWDFFIVYIVPLIITAALIWIVPILSKIAFNVSEKYRKENALKRKKIDSEINSFSFKDKDIKELSEKLKSHIEENNRIKLLSTYLSNDRYALLKNEKLTDKEYINLYNENIKKEGVEERIELILKNYHKYDSRNRYLVELNYIDRTFLINASIVKEGENRGEFEFTEFGNFVSKYLLYKNYTRQFKGLETFI